MTTNQLSGLGGLQNPQKQDDVDTNIHSNLDGHAVENSPYPLRHFQVQLEDKGCDFLS